jgi:fumarate hydratase class II
MTIQELADRLDDAVNALENIAASLEKIANPIITLESMPTENGDAT